MSWNSVNECLPEVGEEVYTYNINGGLCYHILYLDDDGIWRDENFVENAMYDNPPTHWHEDKLLEPPKYITNMEDEE